jgi:hypothetical protein
MQTIAPDIPGYTYGTNEVAPSPISLPDFERLKQSAGFTEEDERSLRLAGQVLADQVEQVIGRWRGIIAATPHLAQYFPLGPDGKPDPAQTRNSGLRFQQWVLDTCLRPYDQGWLNYQQEIALRHTTLKKNQTDGVQAAPSVSLRDVIAFTAVINDTIKPFLAAKGHPPETVEQMHRAWCKAVLLQVALWSQPYTDPQLAPNQW